MDPGPSSGAGTSGGEGWDEGRAGFERACRLPNTVHSEVLPSLPLPTLPRALGFDALHDDEPLAAPDRPDMVMQAANNARILVDTDVSHLGFTPGHNPDAFKVKAPGPSSQGFEKPSAIQQRGIAPFCKGLDVIQEAQSGIGTTATLCPGTLQQLDYGPGGSWEEEDQRRKAAQQIATPPYFLDRGFPAIPATEDGANSFFEKLKLLMEEEKKRRPCKDFRRLVKTLVDMVDLCYEAGQWETLSACFIYLYKRRNQKRQAIIAMIKKAMEYIDLTSDCQNIVELIKTLISICKGKDYVEIKAQLIEKLSKMKVVKKESDKEISLLEEICLSQRKMIETLEIKLVAAEERSKRSDMTASETMTKYENMKKMLETRLEEAEQRILDGEKLRKKLHNTILELKGNIRVFCRVRPLLANESGVVSYPRSGENLGRGIELLHNAQGYSFTFDKVFDHSASQEHVFTEISQLVQSALDGYKVCIFAYGQTGSGKTYTMMGNPELEDQKGMIPRSLEQIFQATQSLKSQGWRYNMQASMLEIYNETICDLLVPKGVAAQGGGASKVSIKHDADGNARVEGLTVVDVTCIDEVSSLLRRAARRRSVGRTQMNEQSSRSHFVFTLRISGVNEGTDQQVQGVLNLIDLAGSERLSKSGATGDRLKETAAINRSLSCLGDVISSIAKKEEHVPFRNSTLTNLLQPYLGGDSKTLMLVNLAPEVSSAEESLCSLWFAAKVISCEIGIPRRQTRTGRTKRPFASPPNHSRPVKTRAPFASP